MQEDETLDEYLKQIKKICIQMHDKKHNLKEYNNQKTVFQAYAENVCK